MPSPRKPRLAVWKFASCDGCQLSLLDCESELLALVERIDIAHFPEASSTHIAGRYDISLVEGSITTPADAERIHGIRKRSKWLIAIGACATAGGIQALRNFAKIDAYVRAVYPRPADVTVLGTSTPIQDHVPVDFELHGCPISRQQLLEVLNAFVNHRRPNIAHDCECVECKRSGTVCVMVAKGVRCLGPVTRAGCGNLCPPLGRGCYGCFGPTEDANIASLAAWFEATGTDNATIRDLFRTYNAAAAPFRRESEAHDQH